MYRCLVIFRRKTNKFGFVCLYHQPILKLLSPVLPLPTPNKAVNQCVEEAIHMANRAISYYLEQWTI
ncbi:unnamed protein product [Urochloa humidicola]